MLTLSPSQYMEQNIAKIAKLHQIEVNHGHKEEEEMGRDMLTSIY